MAIQMAFNSFAGQNTQKAGRARAAMLRRSRASLRRTPKVGRRFPAKEASRPWRRAERARRRAPGLEAELVADSAQASTQQLLRVDAELRQQVGVLLGVDL